ncbi:hypothetical protein QJS10_CPB18g00157 [Acorus calamus]|uniref:Ribulose bisphosphate carboxylase/oxygenase activase, chloroplastic n=1 Tax=Acorus calamus TaxID=4465 RepID=A0AAV9CMY1_ACOCL|nr:hypothetical protein QJS10_CPB18g00157 [Acorus calamus]
MFLCNCNSECFFPKMPLNLRRNPRPLPARITFSSPQSPSQSLDGGEVEPKPSDPPPKQISKQSSYEAKDSEGRDYLYALGQESQNMNISVGARSGVIDDLFVGKFLGQDSDIVFDYRQKATRSFEYLQGDYYIAPLFMDKIVSHIVKNYIVQQLDVKVPLILGIWGGKGQGKTFQTELIFRAMGVEPVIMSAGELESERAGEPGKLIRERYRTASQVIQNQGKLSCLMINDIDAGLGIFGHTQRTVNNQIVVGTLMNLADNPTRAAIREDIINIVYRMFDKDGISKDEVESIVDTFPNQALDFYGALRSRAYDKSILQWVSDIGGHENLGEKLLKGRKSGKLPTFIPPKHTMEALLEAGHSLVEEQKLITNSRLSKEYMKNMD